MRYRICGDVFVVINELERQVRVFGKKLFDASQESFCCSSLHGKACIYPTVRKGFYRIGKIETCKNNGCRYYGGNNVSCTDGKADACGRPEPGSSRQSSHRTLA